MYCCLGILTMLETRNFKKLVSLPLRQMSNNQLKSQIVFTENCALSEGVIWSLSRLNLIQASSCLPAWIDFLLLSPHDRNYAFVGLTAQCPMDWNKDEKQDWFERLEDGVSWASR
jgi:hypothetical protein